MEQAANQAMLFPILNGPAMGPLARAAAEAPLDSTGFLTEYRPLESRSILGKVVSKRGAPFTHAINPYRGCEFGCRYCYARYTHEFLEMRDPQEFERKIYFKQNAAWLLEQEVRKLKPGTAIGIGTATDPYQPIERRQKITRSILEVFAQHAGLRLGIVTKSPLILRDLDLLRTIAKRNHFTVCMTVTTTDAALARVLEPRAPRPDLRIRAIARLRQAGLKAGVLCSPLMPGITDSRVSMRGVAQAASNAGASFFSAGALFLKPCSKPTFLAFVKEHFPQLEKSYEQRYGESAFVSTQYNKRVADLVNALRKEFQFASRPGIRPEDEEQLPAQPWLPFAVAED